MLHKLSSYLYLIQTLPYDYEKSKSHHDVRIDCLSHKSRSPPHERKFFTRIKTLEEQIDATKIKLEGDERTLLVLSMTLPAQLWTVMEGITAKKAMEMLREEVRHQEDDKPIPMARHTSPTEEVGGCWHCHKKGHNKEDCWLLYPEKKKEKQKEKQTSGIQQDCGRLDPQRPGARPTQQDYRRQSL
jgi:uncharacterized protein (DUF2132 family)